MPYVASTASRVMLRETAKWIRDIFGYTNIPYFPIVEFLELVLPRINPIFHCEIVEDHELLGKEGETRPGEKGKLTDGVLRVYQNNPR